MASVFTAEVENWMKQGELIDARADGKAHIAERKRDRLNLLENF